MPETITLEDGSEREVMTDDEVSALKEQVDGATEATGQLTKLRTDLGIDDKANIEDTIKQMQEDADPNYKTMRESLTNIKKTLKLKGIETDESGNPVEKPTGLTDEQIGSKIEESVKVATYKNEKARFLAQHSDEERAVIENTLDKLMVGEEQSIQNLYKFGKQSADINFPNKVSPIQKIFNTPAGGVPIPPGEGDEKGFGETAEGEGAGKAMGLPAFNQPEKK